MPSTLLLLTLPLLTFSLYLYTVHLCSRLPTLSNKRILLLTAHPDDEAMFFAPTVLRLADPALGNHVKILCLSNGSAGGVGEVRSKELVKSGQILGLREPGRDVVVLDDPTLQDSKPWSAPQICILLLSLFAPNHAKTPLSSPVQTTIDVLLTFDSAGVSSHHNHRSCHAAALLFLESLTSRRPGWAAPVAVYTLTSVPLWRKYLGVFDCLGTMLAVTGALVAGGRGKGKGKREKEYPGLLLNVSGPAGIWRAWKAMVQGHWSQMVWFRWGWIALGRYMVVNDLRRVK